MHEVLRWVFISIGFVGAFLTIVISLINLKATYKNRSLTHLLIQYVILVSNLAMFIYGLGLSIINLHSPIFYNSMPTWVGNGIASFINIVITIIIHRLYRLKKTSKRTKKNTKTI